MDVWWNTRFSCKDWESSNWNNQFQVYIFRLPGCNVTFWILSPGRKRPGSKVAAHPVGIYPIFFSHEESLSDCGPEHSRRSHGWGAEELCRASASGVIATKKPTSFGVAGYSKGISGWSSKISNDFGWLQIFGGWNMKHLNLDNTGAKWILLSDEWLSLFLCFPFQSGFVHLLQRVKLFITRHLEQECHQLSKHNKTVILDASFSPFCWAGVVWISLEVQPCSAATFFTEEWLNFAKFLGRCRNRQAAAEEALCQAGSI